MFDDVTANQDVVSFMREFTNVKIKALLGMLARLPWGRRDMLGSMDGNNGGVKVEYVSLIVSCYWIKVFIAA